MSIFEYVSLMQERNSIVSLIGLGILGAFLVFVILKMLGGMRKGTWNKLICVGTTLLAAAVAYIVGCWLSNHIIGSLNANTFAGIFEYAESYVPGLGSALESAMNTFDAELIEYLLLIPATLFIMPVITTLLFLLLNFILKIVRGVLTFILGMRKAKNMPERLGGAVLGAVEAVIWITMIVLPICATMSLIDQGYQKAITAAEGENKEELIEFYDEYFLPFTENPALCFINEVAADEMANGLATVDIEGEDANMRTEVLAVAHIIIVDSNTLKDADYTALTPEQKEAFSSIINAFTDSPIISRVFVNFLHAIPSIYNNGIIPINLGDSFGQVLDDFMAFLESTTRESLKEDLNTIKDFYFGFCDSGILKALSEGKDIMQFVNDDYKGDRHILGMINTLSGNPRTQKIVDGLYNFVLSAAFAGAGDSEGGEVLENIDVEEVKGGLNNVVSINKNDFATEEEYREELNSTIENTIKDTVGVELEKEVVEDIADYVDEHYGDRTEDLTDEEFNNLMFEVIDIYQKYLNGEEVNPDELEGILP